MKRFLLSIQAASFFLVSMPGLTIFGAEGNFTSLFPGDSLTGWRISDWSDVSAPQKVAGEAWKIQEGMLFGLNKRTWLISPVEYENFTIKFESNISKGSNGGFGIRFPDTGDPAYTGMEIQIVDHEVYYRGQSQPQQRTGSIYDEMAPTKEVVQPPGKWNAWEITAQGKQITINLNGETIIDADLSQETQARQQKGPALSKRYTKGHIGFQNLNGFIVLRNLQIKDLGKVQNGFRSLCNGKNLDGWVNVNCAPETWSVRDEMIVCTGIPTGVLRTNRQYENYIVELEWKHLKKGGNAGLFIHSDAITAPGQPFTRAIECQVMDGNGGDMFAIHGATMTPAIPHPKGWMRALPTEDRTNPAGQWNHYRVESKDGMVSLAVNGKIVTRGYHCNPRKGYICLESEGSEVHFRNIRIKELPGDNPSPELIAKKEQAFRCLYNGVDLRGWKQTPGNQNHWQAKNWILDYDGHSEATGENKHLWTEEEFGDFILIVDWRFPAEPQMENVPIILPDGREATDLKGTPITAVVRDAGDSGIYLRGTSKSQINIWNWPVGSGEIWGYRTDKMMPAEVRRDATPILNADNPVGMWNRFEITCIKDRVTVVLNGKTVIRNAPLPGMPAKGPIALQHHGDPLQFANIYIKELK